MPAWLSLKEYCKEVTGSAMIDVGINTLSLTCSMKTKGVIEKKTHIAFLMEFCLLTALALFRSSAQIANARKTILICEV